MSDLAKMAAIAKHFVNNGDGSVHLHSENGTAYELAVGNDGALTVTNEATGAVSGGGGSGLPTGGAAHQMLVTDAEGKALWEDRLAYAYTGMVEILPETTVTGEGEIPITEPFSADLVAGNEYTFTCNGDAYTCKAQEYDMDGVACVALGNLGAVTGLDDTGEPFVLVAFPPAVAAEVGAHAMLALLDGSTSATIKISYEGETVHRLDRKYLPEYIYGDEVKDVTFLSETTLEPVTSGDGATAFVLTNPYDSPLVMNAVYTVMWNGTEHKCTPIEINSNGTTLIVLEVDGVFQITDEINEYEGVQYFGTINALDALTSLTISITGVVTTVHQVPDKYLPKLNLVNGSAEGSLRSVTADEEDSSYTMGEGAVALGWAAEASGQRAVALGLDARAKGSYSAALAGGTADGVHSTAIGYAAYAGVYYSTAIGTYVRAKGKNSFVIGCGNKVDENNKYVFIIGNGRDYDYTDESDVSNAHTIDWDGNAWYQGYVEGTKLILPSPNGTRWAITVGDDGTLSAAAVTE